MKTPALDGMKIRRARESTAAAAWTFTMTAAIFVFLAALIAPSASLANKASAAQADSLFAELKENEVRTFAVDVALGTHYFQNNIDPTETLINPLAFSPGDTFVQDGAVYPAGTISPGTNTFDPNTPGAVGKYHVRGTWTIDLPAFELAVKHDTSAEPEMAFATEILSFGNDRTALMTDGMYPNANFSAHRVVLGGTGRFRGVIGQVEEENIGETINGCNFRLKFKIHRANHGEER